MSRIYINLFYFLQIFHIIKCQEGFYSIIAPNTIHPNSKYHVAVSIHKSFEPATVKLGIISNAYSNFKTVEVRPHSTELVQFQIGELKPDKYRLTAEGITGIIFTNETQLKYDNKQLSVLVQTDKAIYKPNDIVRYRILVLDSNLRPVQYNERINVQIKDGDNNRIKYLTNIHLVNNVYSDEFLLSSWPVLGKWTIEVETSGQIHQKNFEIAEYVLPKFDIIIESQKNVIYDDEKILATVKARHNYGKPIKGEVTLSVYPKFLGSIQPFVYDLITRKATQFDGKASFEFNIKNELKFKEDYQRDIFLEAIVEEQSTGRKQNTTITVTIHKDRYIIEPIHLPKYYVPGLPFEATIRVLKYDRRPLEDSKYPVTAYLTTYYGSDEIYNKTDYKLDNRGITKLKFTVPKNDTDDHHSVIVQYLDISTNIGTVERKMTHIDSYIQAEILTESPKINQEVTVAVRSNQKMNYLMYQIVGRGDILLSKTVNVPNSDYHSFKFLSTFAMVPKAQLLVYFVENGNFIFDEQPIKFESNLWNFMKIDIPNRAVPGQDIDITITTKPYSFIGLMAVDENSVALRQGNDFTLENLFDELRQYNFNEDETQEIQSWKPGFQSGVVTLTNSDYYFEIVRPTPSTLTTTQNDSGKLTTIKKTDIGPAHKFELNTRPPLAGPYAFSRIPKPFWNHPRVHVKYDIENTWLFMNLSSSGSEGRISIHKKLPNSLTSWQISGFSLDPVTGLGITNTPQILQTYRQFYLTTDLPYSVKKGEVLSVPFVINNNMDKDIDTEVTLYNTAQEFEFPHISNEVEEAPRIELYHRRNIKVLARSSQSVAFLIRPKKIGQITIKAMANSPFISDTLETSLLVEPEGTTIYHNKGFLIDLRSITEQKINFTLQIPKNFIPESLNIEVSVVGDILGPVIKNLDQLVRIPLGCGEQNMVNFVPNILILEYLEKINKLSPATETKAKQFLKIGYQQQLSYKHSDGSFSPFGKSDKNGSTWLTAYVARWFRHAIKYTEIDEEIIESALKFLNNIQASDGSFPEVGYTINQMYGTTNNSISLTAFTLLAFIENSNYIAEYKNTINKGLNYLASNLESTDDLFSLAIGSYVTQLAGQQTNLLYKLDAKSVNLDGKKWWNIPIPDFEKKSPWYNKTRSLNIEATSYAALTYLESDLIVEAYPIIKWLIDQRNINGGFISTQDTVIGLQALIKFAEKLLPAKDTNIQVAFEYGTNTDTRMNVNDMNSLVLQSYMLPPSTRNITINASGRGIALAQISYRYNLNVTGAWPRFSLDPQVNRISHSNYLHLSICTSFVSVSGETNRSNMAIMQVEFPSGFTVDTDTLPSLQANERIKKVETKKHNTMVVIYFDYLDRRELCPTLDAHKTHKVAKHKPVAVVIYDYYDNARKARMFYSAPKTTLCSICDESECGDGTCAIRADKQSSKDNENNNNSNNNNEKNRSSSSRYHNFYLFSISLFSISLFFSKIGIYFM